MQSVVFSKFSNERADRFKIRTDIIKDNAGALCVRKYAVDCEAKAHIQTIWDVYEKLKPLYEAKGIKLNRCTKSSDNQYVEFEYLEGETLQDRLDHLFADGRIQAFTDEIMEYAKTVRSIGESQPFTASKQFVSVFGDITFESDKQATSICNIDLIFPNIILNGGWNVIDFEWTFDFLIPTDFVIYRAVHYFFQSSKYSSYDLDDLFRKLHISAKDMEEFEKMEHAFQLYILGGLFGTNNLYPLIAQTVFDVQDVIEKSREVLIQDRIRVFYDCGEGFSEEHAIWVSPLIGTTTMYEFPVLPGTKSLRVDPKEEAGILRFRSACVKENKALPITCNLNGELLSGSDYLFLTDDPNLVFDGIDGNEGTFYLEILYEPLSEDMVKALAPMVEVRKERDRLALYNHDLTAKFKVSEKQAVAYQQIVQSAFWKFSKPQRKVIEGLKSVLHHNLWLLHFLKDCKHVITCKGIKGMREFNQRDWEVRHNMHVTAEISLVTNPDELRLEKEKADQSAKDIKFSILVPLYNTPELYLRKMIESVLSQTYDNFELCLADGSDRKHRYVGDVCREYRWHDKRIVYKKLKKNLGISENTNACLSMATGDYIVLFDHDDFLHPSALYRNYQMIKEKHADLLYSDENTFHETIDDAFNPHYKPDFSPDYLRAVNYICHLTVFSKALLDQVGGFRKEFDGSQDYDMILRLSEKAQKIVHIPEVLYFWRAHAESTANDISAKTYCMDAAKKALAEHLNRIGLKGTVSDAKVLSWYRISYELTGSPMISIVIPNMDHIDLLKRCIDSILEKTTYDNYEILVVENNSKKQETFDYYAEIEKNEKIRILTWDKEFNYSAINNFGVRHAKGEYVLLLNNDVEVITNDWLQEMLMYAQRDDVGAVGAKLYYPDNRVQHAGVILGIGGVAGHSHKYYAREDAGYFGRLVVTQNLSAVTAACMLMPKKVYDEVGGLDEGYQVAFNDVDLCMKIRQAGYNIIYTPYAELYHYESISRGMEDTPEKVERFNSEVERFMGKWSAQLEAGDPYYNPNLTLEYEDFRAK